MHRNSIELKILWYGMMSALYLYIALSWALSPYARFKFNVSSSLPHWVYLKTQNQNNLSRDDLISFKMNIDGKELELVKTIAALEGDEITVSNNLLFINGDIKARVLSRRTNGETLTPIDNGVIPKGKYFSYTTHSRSFDSRYKEIGLIDGDAVEGKVYVVF